MTSAPPMRQRSGPPAVDPAAPPVWTPIRGPFQRWPRASDFLLACFAIFMSLAMWWTGTSGEERAALSEGRHALIMLLMLAGNGAIYWRRREPVRVHWIVLGASAVALTLMELENGLFGLAFTLYALGRYAEDDRDSQLGVAGAVALAATDNFILDPPSFGGMVSCGMVFLIWYIGRRLRFRGEHLRLLELRAQVLEREKRIEADQAVASERTRIARELHDIVAHQVSLMTVQAGAAKTVAESDPAAAREAMGSVEKAGRQALDELRHLLGVLRPGDGPASTAGRTRPQPGRADLPELVKEINAAGLEVELVQEGPDLAGRELPARLDLAVYRIVREALTNVLKHAGPGTAARVKVARGDRGVALEVLDNGQSPSGLPGAGQGIAGMRERAQLLGGWLEAEAVEEGGFRVRAFLPLEEQDP